MARQHYETLQEVFDDAYRGLAAQGFKQSMKNIGEETEHCAYRGDAGLRCAIGHCIPDHLYRKTMDVDFPFGICSIMVKFSDIKALFNGVTKNKLAELQSAHDEANNPEEIRTKLSDFAMQHALTIPSIEEAK